MPSVVQGDQREKIKTSNNKNYKSKQVSANLTPAIAWASNVFPQPGGP